MESDAEEAALVEEVMLRDHLRPDIEERLGQKATARIDDPHLAVLLDQRHAATTIGNGNHRQRVDETARNFLQLDLGLGSGGSR